MNRSEQPIGIFDSGVGGLTVARAIQVGTPQESMIYFGDRARCPYGDQLPEDVLRYATEIAQFLMRQPVKCIVIACNTAAAVALPTLQSMFDVPVISVIEPGAKAAVKASKTGHIGVIGTSVTMASHAYQKEIRRIAPWAQVVEHACPEFVPLVEKGLFDGPIVERKVREALAVFADTDIDTLVLGCTHYPLLSKVIQRVMGHSVTVISSAEATAYALSQLLDKNKLVNQSIIEPTRLYYTTGDGTNMRFALANWFSAPVSAEGVLHVDLPLPLESAVSGAIL